MKGLIHEIKCGTCAYRKQCQPELREEKKLQEMSVIKEYEILTALRMTEVYCANCFAREVCKDLDLPCAEIMYEALKLHFKN